MYTYVCISKYSFENVALTKVVIVNQPMASW